LGSTPGERELTDDIGRGGMLLVSLRGVIVNFGLAFGRSGESAIKYGLRMCVK